MRKPINIQNPGKIRALTTGKDFKVPEALEGSLEGNVFGQQKARGKSPSEAV